MTLHQLLYNAFGWEAPEFAHLPLILKPVGKGKLSKRDGDKHGFPVFPLEWKSEEGIAKGYREEGYLPDAMINMLALLGWNPGTEQEVFTLDELIQEFSMEKVSKSGARFNPDKTIWFNHQYIQNKSAEEILPIYKKTLEDLSIEASDEFHLTIIDLMKERANFIKEIFEQAEFFYRSPEIYDEKAVKKAWKEDSASILNSFIEEIKRLEDFSSESIHESFQSFVKAKEIGFGKLMMPVRLALVGSLQGPDVPVIMSILGKDEVINRLDKIVQQLG